MPGKLGRLGDLGERGVGAGLVAVEGRIPELQEDLPTTLRRR